MTEPHNLMTEPHNLVCAAGVRRGGVARPANPARPRLNLGGGGGGRLEACRDAQAVTARVLRTSASG